MPPAVHDTRLRWDSWHLHYHEDLDRLVVHVAAPLIERWWQRRWIDRFFFVRHPLGGPHLRMRVRRRTPVGRDRIDREIEDAAARYFSRRPSAQSWPADTIRARNRAILAADRAESDPAAYPDNSLHRAVFTPEWERYGGPANLEASLDTFQSTTVEAWREVVRRTTAGATSRLTGAFGFLLRFAWGASADGEAMARALRYPPASSAAAFERAGRRADTVFEDKGDALVAGLVSVVRDLAAGSQDPLARAGAALRRSVDTSARDRWMRILTSHLHMSANRLGLANAEEVYVSRLLSRSLDVARRERPGSNELLDGDALGVRGWSETTAALASALAGDMTRHARPSGGLEPAGGAGVVAAR